MSKSDPNGTKSEAKESQRELKGRPKEAKTNQRVPKESPKRTKSMPKDASKKRPAEKVAPHQ